MTVLPWKRSGSRDPLDGVWGWLALFLGIVALQCILLALDVPQFFKDILTTNLASWLAYPVTGPMALLAGLFPFLFLIGSVWGIVLTVRRHPRAPAFWGWFLLAVFLYKAIDGLLAGVLVRQVSPTVAPDDLRALEQKAWNGVVDDLRYMLWTAGWTWYWNNSRRVRVTFGRNAWARAAGESAPPEEAVAQVDA